MSCRRLSAFLCARRLLPGTDLRQRRGSFHDIRVLGPRISCGSICC